MNCSAIDAGVRDTHAFATTTDPGFAVGVAVLSITSIALAVVGDVVSRPLGAGVGGLAAVAVTYWVTSDTLACDARLGISAAAGVMAATAIACVLRTGVFVLGAAGTGATSHFVYKSVAPHAGGDLYYAVVASSAAAGAIVAHCQRRVLVRVASALAGGIGLAFAVQVTCERTGVYDPPPAALLALAGIVCVAGVTAQTNKRRFRLTCDRAPG